MKEERINKIDEIAPTLYEFNLLKQKYDCFNILRSLMVSDNNNDNLKIGAYTYYLEFLSSLYEFYIASGIRQGAINGKNYKKNDSLITQEVEKLIKFIQINDSEPVSADFAKQFRLIRNFNSHKSSKKISATPSISEFYRKYHKYIMILMEPPLFSWNHPTVLWDDINQFSKFVLSCSLRSHHNTNPTPKNG